MSKARDIADLGAVTSRLDTVGASDGALSNRNAIINGSFKVSQRGDYTSATTVTTNYGFLVDRWVAYGNFGSEFTNANNTAKLEATTSATNRMFLRTNLEAQDILGSTTYTLSFFVTTNSASFGVHINDGSGIVDTSVISVPSGVRTKVTVTFDTPASVNTALEIAIGVFALGRNNTSITTGEYFTLEEVQLEAGDTATPFEHRSYSDELQRCQRYYYRAADGTANALGLGVNYTSSVMHGVIYFPVTMRAIPTLNAASGTNYYEFIRNGAADFFNSLSLGNRTTNNIGEITNNSEISGTVGHGGWIRTDNSAVYVDFDAEL